MNSRLGVVLMTCVAAIACIIAAEQPTVRSVSDPELALTRAGDAVIEGSYCPAASDGCWKCVNAPLPFSYACNGPGWGFSKCSPPDETKTYSCRQTKGTDCGKTIAYGLWGCVKGNEIGGTGGNCTWGGPNVWHCWDNP